MGIFIYKKDWFILIRLWFGFEYNWIFLEIRDKIVNKCKYNVYCNVINKNCCILLLYCYIFF